MPRFYRDTSAAVNAATDPSTRLVRVHEYLHVPGDPKGVFTYQGSITPDHSSIGALVKSKGKALISACDAMSDDELKERYTLAPNRALVGADKTAKQLPGPPSIVVIPGVKLVYPNPFTEELGSSDADIDSVI